jgi:hypothetical protein
VIGTEESGNSGEGVPLEALLTDETTVLEGLAANLALLLGPLDVLADDRDVLGDCPAVEETTEPGSEAEGVTCRERGFVPFGTERCSVVG